MTEPVEFLDLDDILAKPHLVTAMPIHLCRKKQQRCCNRSSRITLLWTVISDWGGWRRQYFSKSMAEVSLTFRMTMSSRW